MKGQKDTDEIMQTVNLSLAKQVQDEMDHSKKGSKPQKKKKKKRVPTALKVVLSLLAVLTVAAGFLVLTKPGRGFLIGIVTDYAYTKLNMKDSDENPPEPVELEDGTVITPNFNYYAMSETFRNAKHEEGVYNILLLGVEAIGYGTSGGHTDAIMIATLNTNTNTLGLTSLMRDSWVTIPGYGDDRLNSVYAKGGVNLMYETIAYNYDLQLDGYALVDFEMFEKVIDTLGGVEVTLTEDEAYYLNHTNYISNKAYRNVSAGTQTLNGNQALGYCRVRKVPTLDGSAYDMGRTSRQRQVMNAVFKKFKKSGITDLVGLVNNVLPLVETDIQKGNCKAYLSAAVEIGLSDMDLNTLRLPEDNSLDNTRINNKAVVVPHWDETRDALYQFVFGKPAVGAEGGGY